MPLVHHHGLHAAQRHRAATVYVDVPQAEHHLLDVIEGEIIFIHQFHYRRQRRVQMAYAGPRLERYAFGFVTLAEAIQQRGPFVITAKKRLIEAIRPIKHFAVAAYAVHRQFRCQHAVAIREPIADRTHAGAFVMQARPGAADLRQREAQRVYMLSCRGIHDFCRRRRRAKNADHRRAKPRVIPHAAACGKTNAAGQIIGQRHRCDDRFAARAAQLLRQRQRGHQACRRGMHHRHVVRVVKIKLVYCRTIAEHRAGGGQLYAALDTTSDQRTAGASTPCRGDFTDGHHVVARRACEHATQRVEYGCLGRRYHAGGQILETRTREVGGDGQRSIRLIAVLGLNVMQMALAHDVVRCKLVSRRARLKSLPPSPTCRPRHA